MDNPTSREILLRYRPGGPEESDPETKSALEAAAQDPETGLWLKSHVDFQKRVRSELQKVSPPKGLAEAIIFAEKQRLRRLRQRQAFLMAAAALVIIGITLFSVFQPSASPQQFAGFQTRMVGTALRDYRMDLLSPDPEVIRNFLKDHGALADYSLPPSLERLSGIGGALLRWNNHPVSMVCLDRGQKQILYVFVIDRSAVPEAPGSEAPRFEKINKLNTASWTDGTHAYLVASAGDEQSLRNLF
jgi:hypothetical protein